MGPCTVPPLVSPINPVAAYCIEPPHFKPCLPACTKALVFYCEPKHSYSCDHHGDHHHRDHHYRDYHHKDYHHSDHHYSDHRHSDHGHRDHHHSDRYHSDCRHHDHHHCCDHRAHNRCCYHTCYETKGSEPVETVKTKYVVPCYRYEDGRIENQPTELMRRAFKKALRVRSPKPVKIEDNRGRKTRPDYESTPHPPYNILAPELYPRHKDYEEEKNYDKEKNIKEKYYKDKYESERFLKPGPESKYVDGVLATVCAPGKQCLIY